ncbi:hypothetical protein McanCB56680_006866 [Microsporum canis]
MGSSNKARRPRKRQTTLSFAPVASSPASERSPVRLRYQSPHSKKPSLAEEKPATTAQTKPKQPSIFVSSDEELIGASSGIKPIMMKRAISDVDAPSSGESDDVISTSPVKRRRTTVQVVIPQAPDVSDQVKIKHDSDSDSDIIRSSPIRQRRKIFKSRAKRESHEGGLENSKSAWRGNSKSRQHKIDLEEDLEELRDSGKENLRHYLLRLDTLWWLTRGLNDIITFLRYGT